MNGERVSNTGGSRPLPGADQDAGLALTPVPLFDVGGGDGRETSPLPEPIEQPRQHLLAHRGVRRAAAQVDPLAYDPSIVNLIDQRVLHPRPDYVSYYLSKSVLHVATQTLAQALAPHIRVNGIGPGPTLQAASQTPEEFAAEAAGTPLGHGSAVEDIVEAVLYLARARSVSGQMIAVDGGQHLAWTE